MLINLAAFQVVWLAIVWGAALDWALVGLAGYLVFAGWQLSVSRQRARELLLTLLVTPSGWLVDSTYVASGLLTYAQPWPGDPFAPWWIAVLWANFVLLVNHGLAPFRSRPGLVAALGAVGGPLAYLGADQLGAVAFTADRIPVVVILAAVWSAVVPLLFLLDRLLARFTPDREA